MYTEKELAMIAKRENNTKRNYLVVDPFQGKHVPVSPSKSLSLFKDLAETVRGRYPEDCILTVGFAETATAIGAQVAISLGTDYIQTTREIIDNVEYLFFSEEHSHATEQKLVKDDIDIALKKCNRILFVEDEVTTGKTILNIVDIIKKEYDVSFSVASILNGMGEEHMKQYADKGIDLFYLVKTDHSKYGEIADTFQGDGCYIVAETSEISEISEKPEKDKICQAVSIDGYINTRRLVEKNTYTDACNHLWDAIYEIAKANGLDDYNNILVVGTEECMYPALYVGAKFEEAGKIVKSHSTTRSPIAVSNEDNYPLHTRYELKSLYDSERKTFIYDLKGYDAVFVITDAPGFESAGAHSLINSLKRNNDRIVLCRWC